VRSQVPTLGFGASHLIANARFRAHTFQYVTTTTRLGEIFSPHGINTTTEFMNYLHTTQNFDEATTETLAYLYPDVPFIGILTTWHARPPPTAQFGMQYKRSSSIGGDMQEHSTSRLAASSWAAQGVPVYAYFFDVLVNGQPYTTGSTHFQEVAFVFYNTGGYGYPQNLLPNPLGGVLRPRYLALAKIMTRM
jgi:triacylglycerol lipase